MDDSRWRRVSITEAKRNMHQIVNEVMRTGEPIVITKHGVDVAVFVSMDDYRMVCEYRVRMKDEQSTSEIGGAKQ